MTSDRSSFAMRVLLPVVIVLALLTWLASSELDRVHQQRVDRAAAQPPALIPIPPHEPPPGSVILKNYGREGQPPEQDLTDLAHALDSFSLLVKGDQPLPLGANEDIASALRGRNRTKLRFLPDNAPCFNAQGQLVDRWQTPLFFHAQDHARLDVRSAGPDRQMWTADDLHRRYDGQFVRGEALNGPSLFEDTKDYRGPKKP